MSLHATCSAVRRILWTHIRQIVLQTHEHTLQVCRLLYIEISADGRAVISCSAPRKKRASKIPVQILIIMSLLVFVCFLKGVQFLVVRITVYLYDSFISVKNEKHDCSGITFTVPNTQVSFTPPHEFPHNKSISDQPSTLWWHEFQAISTCHCYIIHSWQCQVVCWLTQRSKAHKQTNTYFDRL